jgi:hypothetical protein
MRGRTIAVHTPRVNVRLLECQLPAIPWRVRARDRCGPAGLCVEPLRNQRRCTPCKPAILRGNADWVADSRNECRLTSRKPPSGGPLRRNSPEHPGRAAGLTPIPQRKVEAVEVRSRRVVERSRVRMRDVRRTAQCLADGPVSRVPLNHPTTWRNRGPRQASRDRRLRPCRPCQGAREARSRPPAGWSGAARVDRP